MEEDFFQQINDFTETVQLLSKDAQVETQSKNIKLEPLLYENHQIEMTQIGQAFVMACQEGNFPLVNHRWDSILYPIEM